MVRSGSINMVKKYVEKEGSELEEMPDDAGMS